MSDEPLLGEKVRVSRPGTTVLVPWVEYYGRVVSKGDDGTVDVLDEARHYPGEPGAIRCERIEDVTVGWWEHVWHDGRESRSNEAAAERGT